MALACAGCDIRDETVEPSAPTSHHLLRADAPALAEMLGRTPERAATQRRVLEYVEGFDAGLKRAAAESKPLLVICRAAWCPWSAELTQGPLADPRVIRVAKQFVCVMIDADRHAGTCRELGVTAFPTLIVLGPSGEERLRTVGRPASAKLAAALEAALRPSMAAESTAPRR